ncbi:VCBS repeat-containing protein [Streptomyces sp. NBC_00457]|uniref:FG-GAP repeat domain-containing protein n=1 Tax=Streptomyces sp. NBC_00457 TaxID=2975748 RepID=UPI002E1D427E
MARHAYARLRVLAASAVLAAGLAPLLPSTAVADVPQETVVPARLRGTYTSGWLYTSSTYAGRDGAGAQGVFHSLEGSGLVWTRYSDGTSVKVVHPTGYSYYQATGGDVLAYRYADGRVDLWNAADNTTRTIRTPEGLTLLAVYADLAIAYREVTDENGTTTDREMHLLLPQDDGSTRDVPVTGVPGGYSLAQAQGGDADALLFLAGQSGGPYASVMVDRHTGRVQSWTPPVSKIYRNAQVTADHVVLFNRNEPTVQVYSRTDLSAAPVAVTLDGGGTSPALGLAVVGDWLLTQPGTAVMAKPIAGGPSKTLLPVSEPGISAAPDGGALAVGRTGAARDDWGVQRIQPGPAGEPTVAQLKALPKPPYKIQGLSLDQGRFVVADYGTSYETRGERITHTRTVAAAGTPKFGESSRFLGMASSLANCPADDSSCAPIRGTADGRVAWLTHVSADTDRVAVASSGRYWEHDLPRGGRITDVSSRYLIHTAAAQQSVYEIDGNQRPVVTRTPGAAALDGDTLWTADEHSFTAHDLAEETSVGFAMDAGCDPTDLQANGRYLYWTCGSRAGVYDRTAKKSVAVPVGEAKLGDGYVVTHDKQAGKLTLTTVANGAPASRVIGELPDTGVSQRDVRWTVDESGGNAAYVDAKEQVHLVPSGVPQQPLRPLAPVVKAAKVEVSEEDEFYPTLTTALLSKPAAGWVLTVRDKATGKVVDNTDGGAVRGELKVGWDGRGAHGLLPSGPYDWTLSVTPADGVGAPLSIQGTVRLLKGRVVHRDYVGLGDGTGDLLTFKGGEMTFHGGGDGTVRTSLIGDGWNSPAYRAVPLGDLNGDNCNDVLLKTGGGALHLYKPRCDAPLRPSTSHTTLGTSGWNQYDVLTAPGDLTKDGRPDLIARHAATGAVYLYKGTSTGKLASRIKLVDNWKTYKKVVGAGDLNGDGIGDLLAQDKANNLYRYYGAGNGRFGTRVRIATGWGASYNAVIGVGDITGDGKSDLVMRDTAGNLYRQTGTGKGSFAARVKIGTGWQHYKGLY